MPISSEKFIELFITVKQIRFLQDNKNANLYNESLNFSTSLLREFILHSKKDYRYKEFLSCFNFDGNYSLDLIFALNRALNKHLLTGVYDDIAYISRYYTNVRVIEENNDFYSIMLEFIEGFEWFCINKEAYLSNSMNFVNGEEQGAGDNSRMIFDLQQRIRKNYEE